MFVTGAGDGDLATGDTDSTEIGGGLDAIGDDGVICAVGASWESTPSIVMVDEPAR